MREICVYDVNENLGLLIKEIATFLEIAFE